MKLDTRTTMTVQINQKPFEVTKNNQHVHTCTCPLGDSTRDMLDASSKLILCSCPHIPRGCFCHLGIYSAMVISCRAVGCTNKQSKDNMAFYLMPKYMERKQKWIVATYHKYWQLARHTNHTRKMLLLIILINCEACEVRISYLIWFHARKGFIAPPHTWHY